MRYWDDKRRKECFEGEGEVISGNAHVCLLYLSMLSQLALPRLCFLVSTFGSHELGLQHSEDARPDLKAKLDLPSPAAVAPGQVPKCLQLPSGSHDLPMRDAATKPSVLPASRHQISLPNR